MEVSDQVWLLGAALLGYAAAMLTEYLRDKRLERSKKATRALERKMAVDDRRDQFQRETLLDLMNAIHTCTSAIMKMRDDVVEQALSDNRARRLVQLSERNWSVLNDVARLTHRVIDDEIRRVALDYFGQCGEFIGLQATTESPAEARQQLDSSSSNILILTGRLMGLTGRRLRELYGKGD